MGICSLEAVVGKDGKEYIIEINDCATTLLGESQEEDRKNIAELVITQMEVWNDTGQNLDWSSPRSLIQKGVDDFKNMSTK